MPQGIYPCADGYIEFNNAGIRYDRVTEMLNHAEWLDDPRFIDPAERMNPIIIEEWNAHFLGWCVERTKRVQLRLHPRPAALVAHCVTTGS